MDVLLDSSSVVMACGAVGLTPRTGQRVATTDLGIADFKVADAAGVASGSPYDVIFDGSAFSFRTRTANALELDVADKADLQQKLQAAINSWSSLTAAQKDALLLACVRAALRALR